MKLIKRWLGYITLSFLGISITLVALLNLLSPPTTAFMLYQHLKDLSENRPYQAIEQYWVNHKQISPYAFKAVIASEDQLFYQHQGFDTQAIVQAYQRYSDGGRLRGASTISQQVAKNLFLLPHKNLLRKLLEIWFTVLLEVFCSKPRILELYLNIAEFGDHVFGIEAASRRYFGISARQLTPQQAALLAATLPNPLRFRADHPSDYLYRRQAWILQQMH